MITSEIKTNWNKIILIVILFLTVVFGLVLTKITSNVLFVERIGVNFLPYTYLANAILTFLVALFIAGNINRFNINKIAQTTIITGIISFSIIYFLIKQDSSSAYPIFLIYGNVFYSILGGIFMWDIVLKLNTPFEAKKNSGYFNLGASFGGIVAGSASSFLSGYLGTDSLIILIIISQIVILTTIFFINHNYKDQLISATKTQKIKSSSLNEIKSGLSFFKNNRLIKLIFLALVIHGIIRWIVDFEFQKILGENFEEKTFSQIAGFISIFENIILFAIFLFLQKWILTRVGIMMAILLAPILISIPFIILLFIPLYYIAIALKLTDTATYRSLFSNPIQLIFSTIPSSVQSKISTIVKSSTEAIGTLIAGVGLILLTKFLTNYWIIGLAIGLSMITISLMILIKKAYVAQIIKNLESKDTKDLHSAIENLAEPAYHKIGVIELMKLIESKKLENETIRKIIFALGKIDNVKVIPSLLEIFANYDITIKYSVIEAIHSFTDINKDLRPLPFTRMNILDTYKSIFLKEEDPNLKIFILEHLKDFNEDEVIKFLKTATKNRNPEIQSQAIKAMRYFADRGIAKYVKPFLENQNIRIKASAIIALWQFTEMRPKLIQKFIPIIINNDKEHVLTALYIISKLKFTWESHYVLEKLKNPDKTIATMAGLTLTQLNNQKGIKAIIGPLITKNPLSKIIARNLENMPKKIKNKIFKEIKKLKEKEIENCIEILKSTYLNFSEEIKELREGNKILHLT